MGITFNKAKYQPTTEWNFEDAGTLAANARGYRMKFSKKNLAKTDGTRVTILLSKTEDFSEAETLMCTKPLSEEIRTALAKGMPHKKAFAILSKLSIIVDKSDETKYFLSKPQNEGGGEMLESFKVDEVKKDAATYESEMMF